MKLLFWVGKNGFIEMSLGEIRKEFFKYSKTCVKRPLKIDKTKILMTNGSLMMGKSIAECSPLSILQYFCVLKTNFWSF